MSGRMEPGLGLDVVLFSGDRIRFDHLELPRALLHRYMLLFYGVLVVALSQLQLYELLKPLSPAGRLAVVAVSELASVLFLLLALVIIELTQPKGRRRVLKSSVFSFCAAGISCVASEFFVDSPSRATLPGILHFIIIWASIHVIVEISTHFVMLQIMRRVLRDMRGGQAEPMEYRGSPSARIGIKGQDFLPDELVRITAEGNYIRVVTRKASHFLPGPFGPVIDGLPKGLGLQVSRSDWVGKVAVAGLRKEGRDLGVALTDGAVVRVAQSRRKAVAEWVEALHQGDREGPASDGAGMAMSIQTGK